ncbi:MAG: shikimate kinase [Thermoplasmata archaeon]
MKGDAETTAAITIVNALSAGVGSAVGIELRVRAGVELHPEGSRGKWDVQMADEARTPLVIAALTEALRRFAPDSSGHGSLTLRSGIPSARGLKSSSAVSSAIVLAVARATDSTVTPLEVARISAAVSRSAGVSATGALDDALASLTPGLVVTDNRAETLLASYLLPPGLGVALYVPPGTHRRSPDLAGAFGADLTRGRRAADLALKGDWASAMRENTEIVERAIGYDYGALRTKLAQHGAIASGVSGMGPAIASIGPSARLPEMVEALPVDSGNRRAIAFSRTVARDGEAMS